MNRVQRLARYIKNRLRYINFFTKLVFLFMLAVFVPLLVFSILFVNNAVTTAEQKTSTAIETNFHQAYTTINNQFDQLKKYGDMLINDPVLSAFFRNNENDADYFAQRNFKEEFDNTLTFIENSQGINRLRIYVDPKYFYIMDAVHYFSLSQLEEVPWFDTFGQITYRSMWLGAEDSGHAANASAVLPRGSGPTLSYLVKGVGQENYSRIAVIFQLDFSLDDLQDTLKKALFLPGSSAMICDENGGVIAHAALGEVSIPPEVIANLKPTAGTANVDGKSYFVRQADFDMAPWQVYFFIPQTSVYAYSDLVQTLFFIFFAFIIAVIILVSTLTFSKRITNKIRLVRRGMQDMRNGNFYNIPTGGGHDEIDELIHHYNYTVDELQLLIEAKYLSGVELKSAQLQALQAQINPHFLYNTLELINCYAFAEDPSMVENLVSALSRFYKLSLNHGKDVYQLWQELQLVEAYFSIQNIRYPGSLTLTIDVPASMMQYNIPNITLQPIVENSIGHGIMNKPDKTGSVLIKGELIGREIVLKVIDDGVGIDQETLAGLNAGIMAGSDEDDGGSHYGIYNINQRIQHYYGADFHLLFESEPGRGTTVTMRLPVV